MRRALIVAFALVASLLVVSATPAAAASANLAVASQYTSDTEFNNATTLSNVTVSGGNVNLKEVAEGSHKWAFDDSSDNTTAVDSWGSASGSINGATYTTGKADEALSFDGNDDYVEASVGDSADTTFTTWVRPDSFPSSKNYIVSREGDASGIILRANSSGTLKGYVFDESANSFVSVSYDSLPTGHWSHVGFVIDDGNNIELFVNGSRVDSRSIGSRVQDGSDGDLQIGANQIGSTDPYQNFWSGEIDDVRQYHRALSSDSIQTLANNPGYDTEPTGTYVSANHSADEVVEFSANLTLENSNATVEAQAWAGSSWTVVNSSTITSSGNHTLALSGDYSTWRTKVTFERTGSGATARLHDETYLFEPNAPEVSDLQPPDGANVTSREVTLEANVSDADFPTAQSDQVTVEFIVDGSVVDTLTLTSNDTASTTYSADVGGTYEWYVRVSDDYGLTTTSATYEFTTPSTLYIRKEGNPDKLVKNVTVEVTAYYGDEVQRRNVSDGKMNLTGFPVGEPIIVRTNASDYYSRTAVIESVYDQNSIYLLNSSRAAYLVRFDLQDLVGQYPDSQTVLFVERDLELNNSTEWRVIAGDNFGVQGVPVHLEEDRRYRLRIKNLESGTTATIGSYTAIQAETVTLSPGSATIHIPNSEKEYGWSVTENESGEYILFEYLDNANQTDSVTLTIHERFNKSNVLVDNVTFTDTSDLVYQEPLTANQTNATWMAEIYIERNGSVSHFREPVTGPQADIIPIELDPTWRASIGVFVLLITGMAFSQLNRTSGALATALVGGMLWQIGLLSAITTGPAIVLSIAITLVYHYRSGGGV